MAYGREHSATAKFVGCSSRILVPSVAAEARKQMVFMSRGAPAVAISPAMAIVRLFMFVDMGTHW